MVRDQSTFGYSYVLGIYTQGPDYVTLVQSHELNLIIIRTGTKAAS